YYSPNEINAQKDIVIATTTAAKETSEKSGVKLSFRHALSQIIIKAKCDRNDGYSVTAAHTGIAGTAGFGTLSVTTDGLEWSRRYHDGKMRAYSVDLGKKLEAASQILNNTPYLLIPDNLEAWDVKKDKSNANMSAYLVINIKIIKDGKQLYPDEKNWTEEEIKSRFSTGYGRVAIPLAINWEAGKKYIYTVDFSDGFGYYLPNDPTKPGEPILGNPIKIANVEVEDWDDTTPEQELIP
ncbi:MAG: fimbrillin family protein, partial [Muribaculaceae bacterium]|nr:fimbrillin family protein [Muribaculaceae bacterium]